MNIEQWGFKANNEGHLVIGGCDCIKIAGEVGTPLHIVDEEKLRRNYRNFHNAFGVFSPNAEVCYSYKTNCIPGVLKILHEEGAGAEVISPYELWLALKLDVKPNKIIYNGLDKSEEGLKTAIENEVRLININSISEIDKVDRITDEVGKKANVGVRVYTNVGWKGPFGMNAMTGEAFHAYERLSNKKNLTVRGMHSYIGTLIKDPRKYVRNIREILKLAKQLKERLGIEIQYLDLSGGFGISTVSRFSLLDRVLRFKFGHPMRPPKPNDCAPIEKFAMECTDVVRDQCKKLGLREPILFLEPGRFITSSPQVLLLRVGCIKEKNKGTKIAITVGGKANFTFPMGFEYHEAFVANKINAKAEEKYYITGCAATLDWTYKNKKLPKLKEGDILAIMDAGAYFTTFSNNFALPRPAIAMASKGKYRIIRRRETFEYMTALD